MHVRAALELIARTDGGVNDYLSRATVDDPVPVVGMDDRVPGSSVDVVCPVAGVDEVRAVAGIDTIDLGRGLTCGLVVTPDDVTDFAAVDGVVAVAPEQQVVLVLITAHDAVVIVGVDDGLAVDLRPAGMTGIGER